MKTKHTLNLLFLVAALFAARVDAQELLTLKTNGNTLRLWVETNQETNAAYYYNEPRHNCPAFPLTNVSTTILQVVSNNCLLSEFNGVRKEISRSSKRLGILKVETRTVIVTATNTITTQTFTPESQ
jgi:hypothetical protein